MKKKKFFGPEVSNIWSTSAYRNDMSNWTETEHVKGEVRMDRENGQHWLVN